MGRRERPIGCSWKENRLFRMASETGRIADVGDIGMNVAVRSLVAQAGSTQTLGMEALALWAYPEGSTGR